MADYVPNGDQPIGIDILQNLARELTAEWKPLARKLGISEGALYNLEQDHTRNNQETKYQMLLAWRQNQGAGATRANLIEALRHPDVQRADLADSL
ncbi:putative FAS-associated death domain protein-like [Apostichopus japonicus]|uniref:Putative FAS-associated death domain protein-like n=1 Tax=Stichopus japonicus TaxID=307972 RepID=A0A2G8JFB7_STIJA|nr:putative FAS-associated death domain protein-like [Apostichopus japonicus]